MNGDWKEVARLTFKGIRYQDHALDLSALGELVKFQRTVAETAKTLWRAANPDRERLPRHFEERTRLCLRRIEEGSAVAPLEVYFEPSAQLELVEDGPKEIEEAIGLAYDVFRAVEDDFPIPESVPRKLLEDYGRLGDGLLDGESIEIALPNRKPARITPQSRQRLQMSVDQPHEARGELIGIVLEADVRRGQFQLWVDSNTGVTVGFTRDQEATIVNALRDHDSVKLRIQGETEFSSVGKPLRMAQPEALDALPLGETSLDLLARPIEEELALLANEIPKEEWDKLPNDLSANIDHYLYGSPKR